MSKIRILVVDDEVNVLKSLRRVLMRDYDVEICSVAQDAVELLKKKEFALVLSDYNMPGTNGLEFLKQVKRFNNNISTMILTGAGDLDVAMKAINEINIDGYLQKPWDNEKILDLVGKNVRKYKKLMSVHEMSMRDSLTGLYNHAVFREKLCEEVNRCKRYKDHLILFMLDIDHFKSVNDIYGHQSGDKVIVGIANILRENIRTTDFAARYGGEEFCVVFINMCLDQAIIKAEKLRKIIEGTDFGEKTPDSVTISGGLACYENNSAHDIIECADKLLYKAKNSGRNKVCHKDFE